MMCEVPESVDWTDAQCLLGQFEGTLGVARVSGHDAADEEWEGRGWAQGECTIECIERCRPVMLQLPDDESP